jgi:exonuclease VII small subunit
VTYAGGMEKNPAASEQFAALSLELAEGIKSVVAQMNRGNLTLDAAIKAVEDLLARFPSDVHHLAEAVKTGAVQS